MSEAYKDLALEGFADENAALRAAIDTLLGRVAALESERDTYRLMVQVGMAQRHELEVEHRQLRDRHHALLEDYRRLRASTAVAA